MFPYRKIPFHCDTTVELEHIGGELVDQQVVTDRHFTDGQIALQQSIIQQGTIEYDIAMVADEEIRGLGIDILLPTEGEGAHGIPFNGGKKYTCGDQSLEIVIGTHLIKQGRNHLLHLMALPFCLYDVPRIEDLGEVAKELG